MIAFIKKYSIPLIVMIFLAGCAKDQDMERLNQQQAATIRGLNQEIAHLNQELDEMMRSREELANAKAELERRLKDELEAGDMSVSMQDRGLVVTVQDRILFDSGKAELKESAKESLNKVAEIIDQKAVGHMIYIEGHTDNQPIRLSGWRSNWELSTARATEVIHHFQDVIGLDPRRLAASGYGEFHPVVGNESAEGRLANRRVEIVISPKKIGPVA
ncbi:MAG: OmpA family protein [Candidatus Omnitrophica bacterium]|nr:OmpA family protein [Candidatus Omnitrophota bacterium]